MINKRFILPRVCEYDTRWPKEHVDIDCSSYNRLDDVLKALCHLSGKNYDSTSSLSSVQYKYHIKRIEDNKLLAGYESYSNDRLWLYRKVEQLNRESVKFELVEIDNSWGAWIDWEFFRVKGHKKGTMHFEFIDQDLWRKFNQRVAEIKGWKNMVVHTTKGRKAKGK